MIIRMKATMLRTFVIALAGQAWIVVSPGCKNRASRIITEVIVVAMMMKIVMVVVMLMMAMTMMVMVMVMMMMMTNMMMVVL